MNKRKRTIRPKRQQATVFLFGLTLRKAWRFRIRLVYVILLIAIFNFWSAIKWKPDIKGNQPNLFNEPFRRDIFHWKNIYPNVSVFSAYYDDRKVLPNPRISILGFERQWDGSTPYYCFLVYNNKHYCEKQTSTLFVLARDHWYENWRDKKVLLYRPFSFTCSLPTSEVPEKVAISSTKDCETYDGNPAKFIPVVNRKETKKKTFVVCLSSPVYRVHDSQDLVATFEMNRLLGAEFFTVYSYNSPSKALEILQKYSEDGLAEVVDNWAVGMPQPVHYYGQLLSISDCLYKNIYRAKYLVYTDLDEIVMPLRHPSWAALMQDIDKSSHGTFMFVNTFLYSTQGKASFIKKCNGKNINISFASPRYLNFRNRSKPDSRSRITKYITKTDVTIIPQVHKVTTLVHGYKSEVVPLTQALLYHYRIPYRKPLPSTNNRIQDTIMEKYENKLLTAITDRLCK